MPDRDILMPKLEEILYSGYIGQGKVVDEFERLLGDYVCNPNVLSLNSGTSALHLAYRLAGVAPGTSVVTTPVTCLATNQPILANGGDIIWADVDPLTGMIAPKDVEEKIAANTVAIVAVNWGGSIVDMKELLRIRDKYKVKLIIDSAHTPDINAWQADFYVLSFQAIKHLTTVDGGALICRDRQDYEKGKLLRWYGIDRTGPRQDFRCEEDVTEWGYKFHMNDVNATIGILQLARIDDVVLKHRECASFYRNNIKNSYVIQPPDQPESAWWLYTLLVKDRDRFVAHMKEWDIQVSRVHERNDIHSVFSDYEDNLPGVDEFCANMICIPCHSALTAKEKEKIVAAVNCYGIEDHMGL